ncbi:putative ribonuclease H-like domain-containing protein [Tanacetum coccineum]
MVPRTVLTSNFTKKVNTVKGTRVNTARPKAVLSVVKGNKGNVVKASTCWGNPQQDLKDKGVIDSGCSRFVWPNICKEFNAKMYYLVVTDDFRIENLIDLRVKVIRCDNGTEFKNRVMNQFCEMKGIKREFSFAWTPQQNGVAERKNRTLIEAARTMLADSKLPTTFWAEAVNTACYVQNRVLVVQPHNKTPYELFLGRKPALSFMRPFGCPVTILNTIDHLGKFDGKANEGYFVGYSTNSKVFRVFNSRTRIVEDNLHVQFSENTSNIARSGPNWLFDINALTKSLNYKPIVAGNQSNGNADPPFSSSSNDSSDAGFKPLREEEKKDDKEIGNEGGNPSEEIERVNQVNDKSVNNTNTINTVSPTVNAADIEDNAIDENIVYRCVDDPNIHDLEEIVYLDNVEDVGAEANMNNLDTSIPISPILTTRVHKDHPLEQVIGDLQSSTLTRRMSQNLEEYGFVSTTLKQRTSHKDLQNCLFACFLSQEEPKKVVQVLKDPSWIEAMQEELQQLKLQEVWTLVELPNGKRAIGTKWAFRNKKDKRGFEDPDFLDRVYKVEKALYGLHQTPKAWYETLSTYLLDNGFQRGKIDKTLFIRRVKGDILLVQVYVDDIIFGSTKKSLCTEFEKMMHKKFQMSSMGELTFFLGLQVKQKEDGIFISQDKYVTEILKKFGFTDVKTASTPMETQKPLLKDADGEDVDEHLYRSMIGSLMYLTSSRPDIMFAVCACARFQVNPKSSHLHAVKRIFRYLKGQPKLGLWYPKDSPFDLVAYTDSDYAGASLDRKSTIEGCQFLGCRLISWQCKKQTVVANSTTEAEYIAASNYCGQISISDCKYWNA